MDILDDMGVSKLSAKVFWKVNCSFKKFPIEEKKKVLASTTKRGKEGTEESHTQVNELVFYSGRFTGQSVPTPQKQTLSDK